MKKRAAITLLMTGMIFMARAQNGMDTIPQRGFNQDTIAASKWGRDTVPQRTDSSYNQHRTDSNWNNRTDTMQEDARRQGDTSYSKYYNREMTPDSSKMRTDTAVVKLSDRVMMKDGAMVIIKNGMEEAMTKDIRLSSGTVITKEGLVKKKDGTSTQLKDGQYLALPADKKKNVSPQKGKTNKTGAKNT